MTRSILRKLFYFLFFTTLLPLSIVQCTSSDDEATALEEEMATLEDDMDMGEGLDGGIEEMAEISEGDLTDELDDDELDFDDNEGDELAELDEEFDTGGDDEFDDDEIEDFDKEVASSDEDFDEFDEFDDEKKPGEFAQNEKALADELGQQDYPIAEDVKPQFPEEVMQAGDGTNPAPLITSQAAPNDGPLITSETEEIDTPLAPEIPNDDLGMADPIVPEDDSQPPAPSWIPVVKIKTDPFYRNNRLMNAVYIARPDDSLETISQKIYGEDRVNELKADNPHLDKGIDPGDKVYYNSPNRSDDRGQLKFYYADLGLSPQIYKTKDSDNMRRLGSKLLGFNEGWKEVWAINPHVDSKTILPEGLDLKYWTGNESTATPLLAQTSIEDLPSPDPIDDGSDTAAMGSLDEDPFGDANVPPPESPLPQAQVGAPDPTFEPEPVPDIEAFPEEGVEEVPGASAPVAAQPASNDSLIQVGAMALFLIAGVGLVAIQIKKRKEATMVSTGSMEYTQV